MKREIERKEIKEMETVEKNRIDEEVNVQNDILRRLRREKSRLRKRLNSTVLEVIIDL